MLLLLVITALSVYKPWGATSFGRRRQEASGQIIIGTVRKPLPRRLVLFLVIVLGALFVFAFLHHGGVAHHSLH